jgi:hypothetical protein
MHYLVLKVTNELSFQFTLCDRFASKQEAIDFIKLHNDGSFMIAELYLASSFNTI